jgi:hypothetical protein
MSRPTGLLSGKRFGAAAKQPTPPRYANVVIRGQQIPVSKPIRILCDSLWKARERRGSSRFLCPPQSFAAIAQGLGDVDTGDLLFAIEIGERAGDAERAVITAGTQRERIGRFAQQRESGPPSGAAMSSSTAPSHSALVRMRTLPRAA